MVIMIELYPKFAYSTACISCQQTIETNEFRLMGVFSDAKYICKYCQTSFYQTLPIGHARLYPISLNLQTKVYSYNKAEADWLAADYKLQTKALKANITIEQTNTVKTELGQQAILVNLLDSCFGHIYGKLFNLFSLRESYPNAYLICLLPARLSWLAKSIADELWLVDVPLNALKCSISNLEGLVNEQASRFTSLKLAPVNIHPKPSKTQLQQVLATKAFKLNNWNTQPFTITFVWRNDRLWHTQQLEYLLLLASVKFPKLAFFRKLLQKRQAGYINGLYKKLANAIPNLRFNVTGIGSTPLNSSIADLRAKNYQKEKEWLSVYAQSHLIIGVHGSHMLIPTSLSAGYIELLPPHKVDHLTEDTIPHTDARTAQFLGRYLDLPTTVNKVARHILAIEKGFNRLQR